MNTQDLEKFVDNIGNDRINVIVSHTLSEKIKTLKTSLTKLEEKRDAGKRYDVNELELTQIILAETEKTLELLATGFLTIERKV